MSKPIILAKINPVVSIPQQTSIFNSSPSFLVGDYMMAIVSPYSLGSNEANFRVIYGSCTFDGLGNIIDFKHVHTDSVKLSGSVVLNWGQDDSVILDAIADQQGTSIVEVVSATLSNMSFFI